MIYYIIKKLFLEENPNIAIHCISGYGQAPLMLGIAMMQINKLHNKKLSGISTVEIIRHHIFGALNIKHVSYLIDFKFPKKSYCNIFEIIQKVRSYC